MTWVPRHNSFRFLRTALVLVALMWGLGSAQASWLSPEQVQAQMQEFRRQTGVPGVAVAVLQGGQMTVQSLGVSPQARFKVASVSKSFTAAVILRLADQGKLDLDRPVTQYVPLVWQDSRGPAVTVRHLLNQTSGLSDGASGQLLTHTFTPPAELLADIAAAPLSAAAGERFEYANVNYALLALIAERVSGRPYAELLPSEVFAPLELGGEVRGDCAETPPQTAQGHTLLLRWAIPATEPHSNCLGSGDVVASAADLGRWLQENFGPSPTLLTPVQRRLMQQPGAAGNYGMGWYRIQQPDLPPYLGHGGNLVSYATHVVYDPSTQTGVAVLLDTNGPAALLTLNLLRERHGLPAVPMPSPSFWLDVVLLGLAAVALAWALWAVGRRQRWQAWAVAAPRWRVGLSLLLPILLLGVMVFAPTLAFTAPLTSWPVVLTLLPSSAGLWVAVAAILTGWAARLVFLNR